MFPFSLFTESVEVSGSQFLTLLNEAIALLKVEKGRVGNFVIENRLVKLDPTGEALVVGDLHGDLTSLKTIFEVSGFIAKLDKSPDSCMVFLGDYVDRGTQSAEVLYVLLSLKLAFPRQIIMLRGNHEGPKDLLAYPHDLPMQLQYRFPSNWQAIYERLFQLFDLLYLGVYVEKRFLMVHGGVSPKIRGLNDIANADGCPELFADLLWSDPDDFVENTAGSARGVGVVFGEKVSRQVLEAVNAKILIRGHEASPEGFKINHSGRVLTLFSRKGQPYFNRFGVYLSLPLHPKFEDARQLAPFVCQF
ncbi:MAG: metallophosphoesterase [Candidatus Bathyarchaeia archaeon]|jgi:protein phosphatase